MEKISQRMQTSRAGLEWLLDPNNTSITLKTLVEAARVLGKKLQVDFVAG